MAEEADAAFGGNAAGAGEHLQEDLFAFEADDLGEGDAEGAGDLGEFAVGDAVRADGDDVADDLFDAVVDFMHFPRPPRASCRCGIRFA